MRPVAFWSVAIMLVGVAKSDAKDIPVRLTDTLTLEYRTDNENGESDDDNYYAVVNRLNLSANSKSLSTSVRVDSMAFHDSPAVWHRDDARIERLNVTYRIGKYKLQVGDFYQQLGRGIVLALRKVDEVGVDIGVRGGQIKYETRKHNMGVFAGRVNLINMDNFKQRFIEDTDDVLAGGPLPISWPQVPQAGYALLVPTESHQSCLS